MPILVFSPQSKTFVAKGNDGKFTPIGPIRIAGQGVINVNGKSPPGPTAISREKPIADNSADTKG
ncbi:hypothetical protein Mahau_0072 [Mahella australiensis 50-1 BON]|uniref:Uncharacterized protein n=1 Tax=Mahella australiensis (strain DSM 15567 / CIP 107919 / 50-1 BON) TaxID=697281 RepID=F3ZVE5_MAHA5|nr:hypothetical protein Mahau_0072 [Mahella australiensis 50-1 BON]